MNKIVTKIVTAAVFCASLVSTGFADLNYRLVKDDMDTVKNILSDNKDKIIFIDKDSSEGFRAVQETVLGTLKKAYKNSDFDGSQSNVRGRQKRIGTQGKFVAELSKFFALLPTNYSMEDEMVSASACIAVAYNLAQDSGARLGSISTVVEKELKQLGIKKLKKSDSNLKKSKVDAEEEDEDAEEGESFVARHPVMTAMIATLGIGSAATLIHRLASGNWFWNTNVDAQAAKAALQ